MPHSGYLVNGSPYRGRAGVILAAGVAIALVVVAGSAAVAVAGSGSISDTGAALLSTAIGTAIGALATYLGGNRATDEIPDDGPPGRHRPEQLAHELGREDETQ